ncbi:MAG TPA: PAS domain S-box protein, partial [Candidatus Izemoplasmatales bacterium]|nr:PAS domain S-box protein [Candidatus Izemoplasmatales bacterium]
MKLFMPIAKQVNNHFKENERNDFYQKTIIILFKISAFLFVPLMLVGSIFFLIDGLVLFGILEILIAVFVFVFIFLSKPKSNVKLHIILSVFLLTAIFVLVTTGIKGGGFTSLITVSVLIFLIIKYSYVYKYYLIAITIAFIILTFLLYLNVLDSYEIATYKPTWPFMMVLIFTYVFGLSTIILFYKRSLETQIDQIKESEERFRILHNASFGGITIHDKGLIIECNQGLSDITGYSIDELVGMDCLLLIAPDDRGFVMDKIMSGDEEPYEVIGIKKN